MRTQADELWIGFHVGLLVLLGVELIFSRFGLAALPAEARATRQHRNAVVATVMWLVAALLFAGYVLHSMGSTSATQFLAGYAIEETLSIDNLFVFLLLFRVFRIPAANQPRVLFWGVAGAIVMRGAFIAAGLGLLNRFQWVSYVFAVILLAAAVRLVMPGNEKDHAAESTKPPAWTRWISRIHPVSMRADVFFTRENGTRMVTVLLLALCAIAVTDFVFALDSIPAVLSITRHTFIAYSSNILAVMGLRSLYFVLSHALSEVDVPALWAGGGACVCGDQDADAPWVEVTAAASLAVIVGILGITVTASLASRKPVPERMRD